MNTYFLRCIYIIWLRLRCNFPPSCMRNVQFKIKHFFPFYKEFFTKLLFNAFVKNLESTESDVANSDYS